MGQEYVFQNGSALACDIKKSTQVSTFASILVDSIIFLFPCKVLFQLLQFLSVPRIVPDIIISLLHANIITPFSAGERFKEMLQVMGNYGFSTYLFVKGLEMDLFTLLKPPTPATMVAMYTMLTTFAITCFTVPFIVPGYITELTGYVVPITLGFGLLAANTSSPLLTRLCTTHKISKLEAGRLIVSAGITTDMVTTLLLAFGYLFARLNALKGRAGIPIFGSTVFIVAEYFFMLPVGQRLSDWIDEHNPQGKKVDGLHVMAFLFLILILLSISSIIGYDTNMNAFIIGLAMPRHGRLSRFLIGHFNFFIDAFILPFIICEAAMFIGSQNSNPSDPSIPVGEDLDISVAVILMLIFWFVSTSGKVLGAHLSRSYHRYMWQEYAAIGLFLNTKGHIHVYMAFKAFEQSVIRGNVVFAIMLLTAVSILYIPAVAFVIAKVARKTNSASLMGFQWHNPATDLKIVMCFHTPEDMPVALNILEALRWGDTSSELKVFAMDLVELTERTAATLVQGEGTDAVMLADETVTEMRDQIGSVLDAYMAESGEGVQVCRLLAVSTWSEMHDDICSSADENMAVFILLPFHRRQMVNGSMDDGHDGHRQVNIKVQQHSRCTVGILVARGGGRGNQTSTSEASQNVAVVFIGGADDREALSLASRMAQHPGIQLTVIRFLVDVGAAQTIALGHRVVMQTMREDTQMQQDDEFFTSFFEKNIATNKSIEYMERRVKNGAETVAILRSLEEQQHLFVVGKGNQRDSVLTSGMEEWAEFGELGPIGDVLAAPDFSAGASILVVQQFDSMKEFDVIDEDFLPFH